MFNSKTYTAVTLIGLLAACGGGGGGTSGGGGAPRTVFTYQTLESVVPGSSTIVAAGLTQSDPSGLPDGTDLESGTLNRDPISRALTINGVIVSGVFQTTSGSWTDGTTTVSPYELDIFTNTAPFAFMVPVIVTEGDFASAYILGVVSRTQDLPTSPDRAGVTYTGVARVEGILGSDGTAAGTDISSDGRLTLTADFASGFLEVVIDQLNLEGTPFDKVRIADLEISSNGNATFTRNDTGFITFEGGTGTPSLGASTTESVSGAFFGGAINEIVAPNEAGGVFTVNGENGNTVYGIFAGDRFN